MHGDFIRPLPERRVSNASPGASGAFTQRLDMRDFRAAKTMANTLRATLAANGALTSP